jgi:hypothetical protein
MAETYLLPENIAASDAAMVLAFLNAARNAQEIADAVELNGEADKGLRLANRLLERRELLGGFSTLEEVYAVPLIGPERFTELVTRVSKARPPPAFDDQADRNLLAQISQRLSQLEQKVEAGPTIRLRALNGDALLGQDTIILAQLTGPDGRPLVDQSLTAMSSWGLLSGRAGLRTVEGNSVTVRSNHQGICQLRLAATPGKTLSDVDRASLSRALGVLGSPGDTPRDSLNALGQLAREYRQPGKDSLRRAIDAYFQRYGEGGQLDAPIDSLSAWPRISITVVTWLTPATDSATGQIPTALLNVEQRNWFYVWLWAYKRQLEKDSTLGASLADVNTGKRSGSGVLTDVFGRIGTFVAAQDGLVGQQLGRDFAADNLNRFLQRGLTKISPEQRAQVLTGVTSGVTSLASARAFAAHQNSRAGLKLEIDTQLAGIGSTARLDDLDGRITRVEDSTLPRDAIDGLREQILGETERLTAAQLEEAARLTATQLRALERTTASRLAEAARVNAEQLRTAAQDNTRQLQLMTRDLNSRFDAVGQRIDRISIRAPVAPVGPVGPVRPLDPGPVSPVGPVGPVGPVRPRRG